MSGERAFIEIDTEAQLAAIIQKLDRLPDKIAAPNILKNAINATACQSTRRRGRYENRSQRTPPACTPSRTKRS